MNNQKIGWHYLTILILAGESVFILPFVLSRVFRPTLLEVFELNNLQIGYCFSVYGVVALLSYVFGGPLADRYPPHKIMALSLWSTAVGGLYYATIPSYQGLLVLYGYWGFTTIFLFWASMIKATRIWGGMRSQGEAFGFLDAGRGLVGALIGVLGVYILSIVLPVDLGDVDFDEKRKAYRMIVRVSTTIVALIGVAVWFFLRSENDENKEEFRNRIGLDQIYGVLRLPSVWLLMIIILCAYTGYRITDIFSQYAKDVMAFDDIRSAKVGTFLISLRPLIGIIVGILASRSRSILWLTISFVLAFIGALLFAFGGIVASSTALFFLSTLIIAAGIYGTRALYFAVMKSGRIPLKVTGTAVGIISLVGYTPDIFSGPIIGVLIDSSPGIVGYQHVFQMTAGFMLVGLIAALIYLRIYGRNKEIKPQTSS